MSMSWKITSEIQESRPPTPAVPLPYHKPSNGAARTRICEAQTWLVVGFGGAMGEEGEGLKYAK